MSVATVFKDKLPKGLSFAIAAAALGPLLGDVSAALYFVNQSTWVRQMFPLDAPRLPLLRWQRRRPLLRVGNERVRSAPDGCTMHVVVYALPSAVKRQAEASLRASVVDWRPDSTSSAKSAAVLFSAAGQSISLAPERPWWL